MFLEKLYDLFERHRGVRLAVGLIPAVTFLIFFIPTRRSLETWLNRGYAQQHAIATREAAAQLTRTAKVSPDAAYALANKAYVDQHKDDHYSGRLENNCYFVIDRRYFIPIHQYPKVEDLLTGKPFTAYEDGYYVDMETGQVTTIKDGPLRFPFANAVHFWTEPEDEK